LKKQNTVHCSLITIHCQRGSALVVSLLIVTLLIGLAVEFAYEVYVDSASLSNWHNAQKASLIAKSGQTLSYNYIKDTAKLPYTYPGETDLPIEKDFGPDIVLTVKIEDENSKFNINNIIYSTGQTNEEALSALKKLLEYLNINPDIALAVADWIDPDHEPRLSKSENSAKNSYLWSVDELRLIPGVDKKTYETISPYLTVYGSGIININTAKLAVIVSLHTQTMEQQGLVMTETLAKKIIDYRQSTPFAFVSDVQNVSGMETIGLLLIGRIDVKSYNFRVISTATVSEIKRVVESIMDPSMNVKYWREG
jgi:general secretion pathway protein K